MIGLLVWLMQVRHRHLMTWAREVVETIPRRDLGNHAMNFHSSAMATRNRKLRAMHEAKLIACCDRIDRELSEEAPVSLRLVDGSGSSEYRTAGI